MGLVSIILPIYNASSYLRKSIESCLNQSYRDIEVIVVDDGSIEKPDKVLKSFADIRIRIIRHETNQGLPEALNTGFAHALGQFLTWTSDDNYYEPNAIESMVEFLDQNPAVDFVYSPYWIIDENDQVIGDGKTDQIKNIKVYNCVGGCFLYRRVVYEKVGNYNRSFRLAEDYEYWVRVSLQFRMEHLSKHLYSYRQHPENLTNWRYGSHRSKELALTIRRKYFKLPFSVIRKELSAIYINETFDSYKRQDLDHVRWAISRAILYHPTYLLKNYGFLKILLDAFAGEHTRERVRAVYRRLRGKSNNTV